MFYAPPPDGGGWCEKIFTKSKREATNSLSEPWRFLVLLDRFLGPLQDILAQPPLRGLVRDKMEHPSYILDDQKRHVRHLDGIFFLQPKALGFLSSQLNEVAGFSRGFLSSRACSHYPFRSASRFFKHPHRLRGHDCRHVLPTKDSKATPSSDITTDVNCAR